MRHAMLAMMFVTSAVMSAAAQAPAGTLAATSAAKKHPVLATYEYTRKAAIAAAEAMPAQHYGMRATGEARSFADLVAHSVLTNFGVCAGAKALVEVGLGPWWIFPANQLGPGWRQKKRG